MWKIDKRESFNKKDMYRARFAEDRNDENMRYGRGAAPASIPDKKQGNSGERHNARNIRPMNLPRARDVIIALHLPRSGLPCLACK